MEQKEARYTQEFKGQMVAMYKAGKPAVELVKEYGMSKSTLHKWIGDYSRSGSFHEKDNRSVEENELITLRKENKQLRMENDILKQAALIMAKR
jgi:transposase